MKDILAEIKQCIICKPYLPLGPNPVVVANPKAKIVIIGQAPGTKVHASGIPWDDASGKQLRNWLGVTDEEFYNPETFAIVPMGFCYPGKGKTGDLPPRKECAPQWHQQLFNLMPNLKLVILIGTYAQNYYLRSDKKKTLTETVKYFETYLPKYLVLPHPSPRNRHWLAKNLWFEQDILPKIKAIVKAI